MNPTYRLRVYRSKPLIQRLLLSLSCLSLLLSSQADEWPQFRGPDGDGIADAANVPREFGESSSLTWKIKLPGRGWSSPVFDGEHLWLTTAKEVFPDETERIRLLTEAGEEEKKFAQKQVASSIELALLKVSYERGVIEEELLLTTVEEPDPIHKFNSYASPTPVISGKLVIAHFGTFGTFAIDRVSGSVAWERTIKLEHSVGPGSSPFVHDGRLVLICDGTDRQFVTALDVDTGETLWSKDRPEMRAEKGDHKKAYNTPIVITGPRGREQLICMGSQWLVSYHPESGETFWQLDHGKGFSVVPRPVYSKDHELLFVSTGFGNTDLLAVRPDGDGDVTRSDKLVWKDPKRIPTKPSPLLVGDELYVISDGGVATCFDAVTGKIHWNTRITGNYSASPMFADGHIYVCSEEGKVTLFRPGLNYAEAFVNQIDESIMASPMALDGNLVIRSVSSLYRFSSPMALSGLKKD
ncbi:MAG: PQQ-binding-like beta-propeller repeat protein [Verrucomicrobiota bacterium]